MKQIANFFYTLFFNQTKNIQILFQSIYKSHLSTFMRKHKNFPEFTHFISIPFIRQKERNLIGSIQNDIQKILQSYNLKKHFKRANTNLMHITLSMLTLNLKEYRDKTVQLFNKFDQQAQKLMNYQNVKIGQIKYFTKFNKFNKSKDVSLLYLQFQQNQTLKKIQKLTDLLIRQLLKQQIVVQNQLKSMHIHYDHKSGLFKNQEFHMTLFRVENLPYNQKFEELYKQIQQITVKHKKQQLIFPCDFIDVSTRYHYDETNFYEPLARINLKAQK